MLSSIIRRHSSSLVTHSLHNGIRTVTLNSPANHNALSLDMLAQLNCALHADAGEVRVLVLRSSGRVFSAGHDLNQLVVPEGAGEAGSDAEASLASQVFGLCTRVMCAIREARFPVIAQVVGPAVAAGCQLVASCDMVVATRQASFSLPGVKLGLFCTTPAVAVGRCLPEKLAMRMLCTGEAIDADTAHRHGMLTELVDDEEEMARVTQQIASSILEKSPEVIAMGKSAFYRQMALPSARAAYASAVPDMLCNVQHKDAQSGIAAFLNKTERFTVKIGETWRRRGVLREIGNFVTKVLKRVKSVLVTGIGKYRN